MCIHIYIYAHTYVLHEAPLSYLLMIQFGVNAQLKQLKKGLVISNFKPSEPLVRISRQRVRCNFQTVINEEAIATRESYYAEGLYLLSFRYFGHRAVWALDRGGCRDIQVPASCHPFKVFP